MTQEQQATAELGVNLGQLRGLMGAIEEEPEVGKTVWKASSVWKKGDGFRSVAHINEHEIAMDEPEALGGSATAPNMVEMVLGAYGCCLTTGYVLNASLRGIELENVQIELDADLDLNGFLDIKEDTFAGYTDVRAKVRLTAPTANPEELQALHEQVTRTSPVGDILSRPMNVVAELEE